MCRVRDQAWGLTIPCIVSQLTKAFEPARAGRFLGVHAEAVTTLLVEVELRGLPGRTPTLDQSETAIGEERIVGGARRTVAASAGTVTAANGP